MYHMIYLDSPTSHVTSHMTNPDTRHPPFLFETPTRLPHWDDFLIETSGRLPIWEIPLSENSRTKITERHGDLTVTTCVPSALIMGDGAVIMGVVDMEAPTTVLP